MNTVSEELFTLNLSMLTCSVPVGLLQLMKNASKRAFVTEKSNSSNDGWELRPPQWIGTHQICEKFRMFELNPRISSWSLSLIAFRNARIRIYEFDAHGASCNRGCIPQDGIAFKSSLHSNIKIRFYCKQNYTINKEKNRRNILSIDFKITREYRRISIDRFLI